MYTAVSAHWHGLFGSREGHAMAFLNKGMMGRECVSAGHGDGAEDIPELAHVDTVLSGFGQ